MGFCWPFLKIYLLRLKWFSACDYVYNVIILNCISSTKGLMAANLHCPRHPAEDIALLATTDAEQAAETHLITSPATLMKIFADATSDPSYVWLKEQILTALSDDIWPCATSGEELSVYVGLIYKGHRLVVPRPARPEILNRLYSSHMDSTVNPQPRTRETVYWLNFACELRQKVQQCHICDKFRDTVPKEPLASTPD